MTTHIVHLVPNLDILGHLMAFSGALGVILGQLGARKGFVLLIKWLFGGPRRVPMGHKWASDGNLVNIGQLDHYVVFGTKSGAIHDFQTGKKCHTGVKETPSGPPQTPLEPPIPSKKHHGPSPKPI